MEFTNPLKPLDLQTIMTPELASLVLSKNAAFNPVIYKDNPVYQQPWFWVGYWRSMAERLGDETITRSNQIKDLEAKNDELKKMLANK